MFPVCPASRFVALEPTTGNDLLSTPATRDAWFYLMSVSRSNAAVAEEGSPIAAFQRENQRRSCPFPFVPVISCPVACVPDEEGSLIEVPVFCVPDTDVETLNADESLAKIPLKSSGRSRIQLRSSKDAETLNANESLPNFLLRTSPFLDHSRC